MYCMYTVAHLQKLDHKKYSGKVSQFSKIVVQKYGNTLLRVITVAQGDMFTTHISLTDFMVYSSLFSGG